MDGYIAWLTQIPWQLFGTYTFSWAVSDVQADQAFRAYINEMEKTMRCPIAFVRGDEKRAAAFGVAESSRHFHAVLTCRASVDPVVFERTWYRYGGTGNKGDSAEVRVCTSQTDVIGYCLKLIDETEGDWRFRNLDLFMPGASPSKDNYRSRRRASRDRAR
jgi:hypothetical protein